MEAPLAPQSELVVRSILGGDVYQLHGVGGDILRDVRVLEYVTTHVKRRNAAGSDCGFATIGGLRDKKLALRYVTKNGQMLGFVPTAMKQDRDVVLAALKNSVPQGLFHLIGEIFRDPAFHDDIEVIQAALQHDRGTIKINKLLKVYDTWGPRAGTVPTGPGPTLMHRIRDGAAQWDVYDRVYADVIDVPRCFTVNVTPLDEPECWSGIVQVQVSDIGGGTQFYKAAINPRWVDTGGFRAWYARETNDQVPDFDVLVDLVVGTHASEAPLIDVTDARFASYVPGFLPPPAAAAPPAPPPAAAAPPAPPAPAAAPPRWRLRNQRL